jgi:GNAT superfamily N-acetyltransferase
MNLSKIECLEPQKMSEADRQRCGELSGIVWPPSVRRSHLPQYASEPAPQRDFPHSQRPRVFVVRDGGVIVAKAGLSPRLVRAPRGDVVVLALAGVLSHPDYRKLGLGRLVVKACFDQVDRGDFACSLFQTGVPGFYEKLGCALVKNPMTNSLAKAPGNLPFWDSCAMVYPAAFAWGDGPIDTLGPGW